MEGIVHVAIIGQGYVGLPVAVRAAQVGHTVVGYDVDEDRIKRLEAGDSFIEDVTSADLSAVLESGRYRPTTNASQLADFDVAVISVPTPLRQNAPDLSYIKSAAEVLAPLVRPGCTVVLESTTYPGTTEEFVRPILERDSELRAGVDFHLGYSPERIDPGNKTWTFVNTPKVVSGVTPESLREVDAFYSTLVEQTVPVDDTKVAELTKLLENTFRHVNIALVNELAIFARELDINVWDAIDAASTKPFGYMRFEPGPGVGGHCLPVDPSYLSWRVKDRLGHNFRFVELANDVNEHMPDYVLRRLIEALNRQRTPLAGARVLIAGLAYKRNTGDCRESPSIRIAELLQRWGVDVRCADPHVPSDWPVPGQRVDLTAAEVSAADAVVFMVGHDAFDLSLLTEHGRFVLDTRNCLRGTNVESL